MNKMNLKILFLTFVTLIIIACDSQNAIDFEDDKNRIISEMVRDTVFINDTTIIVETEIVHDTITDVVYDTIYITKERKLYELFINNNVQLTEYWYDGDDLKSYLKTYSMNEVSNLINGTLYLDSLEDNVLIHTNFNFTRTNYRNEKRDEWLFKLLINTRYLNFDNETILLPFGQNPGFFHYFTAITTNSKNEYFSKVSQNSLLRINFKEKRKNSFIMEIEGVMLLEDIKIKDLGNPKSYITFILSIPLEFK